MKRDIKKKKEVYQKPQIRSEKVELNLYGSYAPPEPWLCYPPLDPGPCGTPPP